MLAYYFINPLFTLQGTDEDGSGDEDSVDDQLSGDSASTDDSGEASDSGITFTYSHEYLGCCTDLSLLKQLSLHIKVILFFCFCI